MDEYSVITVAWQYGSGGERLAVRLAERLGIPCYVKESGDVSDDWQISGQERGEWLYLLATGTEHGVCSSVAPPLPAGEDRFFVSCEMIRRTAARGPCVIASELGEFALRERKDRISIFICADRGYRRRTIERDEGLSSAEAVGRLEKADRRQRSEYGFYTGERWDALDRYALCVNASALGEERTVALMEDVIKRGVGGE